MTLRVVLEALRWSLGPLLLCRLERLMPPSAEGIDLDIAVVIPARDEEGRLGSLLASLATQRHRPAEVVVVDDGSTDATVEVARRAGFEVMEAPPRPHGWNGKQWACHTGIAATTAPILCFLDADVVLAPDALERVVRVVAAKGGLVSVQPHHVTESLAEGLSLFPNLVSMMGTDAFGPLRGRIAPSGAFGPVLACRRADHAAVGGHEAVRRAAMEDVALAGTYRRGGLPVTLYAGGATVHFRMHDGGVRSVIQGWTRGLGDGARSVRLMTLVVVAGWLSGVASAPLIVAGQPTLGLGLCAAYAIQLGWLGRRIGRFPILAWLVFPVALAFFVVAFLRSVALVVLGRTVLWKDRRIRP